MPGLSVLLPVYNRNVTQLVRALLDQAADWGGPVEICCLDDASAEEFQQENRALRDWPGVEYAELAQNLGRAAIRNRLAADARHEWLLLLDNDSELPDTQFLARYTAARGAAPVLVGGTAYQQTPPEDASLFLRWQYGCQREARPAMLRQRQPHEQLTLNNLLIRKEIFCRFWLDEALTRYGHEDTKLGWQLQQAGIAVHHLDNPVLHDGLEPAPDFLHKTHQAVRNLVYLHQTEGWGDSTRLLRAALRLRRTGLAGIYRLGFQLINKRVRRALLSTAPSLAQLDALKLYWVLQELRRRSRNRQK